jgi:hypothetical protein
LRTILTEDLIHLLLLLLRVDASDIVVHDGELVAVLQYFLRTVVGSLSLFSSTVDISPSFRRATIISSFAATTSILLAVRSMLLWRIICYPAEVPITVLLFFLGHFDVDFRSHSCHWFALLLFSRRVLSFHRDFRDFLGSIYHLWLFALTSRVLYP